MGVCGRQRVLGTRDDRGEQIAGVGLLLEGWLDMRNEVGVCDMGIYGEPIVFWTRYLLDGLVQHS